MPISTNIYGDKVAIFDALGESIVSNEYFVQVIGSDADDTFIAPFYTLGGAKGAASIVLGRGNDKITTTAFSVDAGAGDDTIVITNKIDGFNPSLSDPDQYSSSMYDPNMAVLSYMLGSGSDNLTLDMDLTSPSNPLYASQIFLGDGFYDRHPDTVTFTPTFLNNGFLSNGFTRSSMKIDALETDLDQIVFQGIERSDVTLQQAGLGRVNIITKEWFFRVSIGENDPSGQIVNGELNVNLDIFAQALQFEPSDSATKELITKIYTGYYNRAPDPEGLAYWIGRANAGMSAADIAQSFSVQTESTSNYPYLVTQTSEGRANFITSVYANLFNRAPDAEGLAYWLGQLESGRPVGSMILDIINGAVTAPDKTILDNKVVAGIDWATDAAADAGFTYNAQSAANAHSVLAGINVNPSSVDVAKNATDAFFALNNPPTLKMFDVVESQSADFVYLGAAPSEALGPHDLGNQVVIVGQVDDGLYNIA